MGSKKTSEKIMNSRQTDGREVTFVRPDSDSGKTKKKIIVESGRIKEVTEDSDSNYETYVSPYSNVQTPGNPVPVPTSFTESGSPFKANVVSAGNVFDAESTSITWQAVTGQYAYEIQYKLKRDAAWLSCGVINSTNNSASFSEISNKLRNKFDLSEYHYRVCVYSRRNTAYGNDTANCTEERKDITKAYNLVIKPTTVEFLQAGTEKLPIYNGVGTQVKLHTANGAAGVVDNNHSLASHLKVCPNGSELSVAGSTPRFSDPGINSEGDVNGYVSNCVEYTYSYAYTAIGTSVYYE